MKKIKKFEDKDLEEKLSDMNLKELGLVANMTETVFSATHTSS